MTDRKKLFVIDGHALCYRAYYALIKNPLTSADGQNVSAIFGFARMLFRLVEDQNPDYVVVAFDPPKKSFRFGLYPEYKANRVKMPEDLRSQITEIKSMIDALRIRRLEHDDFEGDDIMGTIAARYSSKELLVCLVTGDKDAYQLVDENVIICAPKKGTSEYEFYDQAAVREKLGLEPRQVIDYMALMGDSSDNVPGVRGIGEKTALKLISSYGSLDNLYAHLDELKGRQRDLIAGEREMAYLSRDLVTIRTDVDIDLDFSLLGHEGMRSAGARDYFRKLEMKGIIKDYFAEEDGKSGKTLAEVKRNYRIVRTEKQLIDMLADIEVHGVVSVDTETTSLFPMEAELVGISFSVREHEGWYVPMLSRGLFSEEYFDPRQSLAMMKPMLEDPSIRKIGQNIKYDAIVLKEAGVDLRGIYFDTMVASYLLSPS
jgi:DNA polymerase-1